MNRGGLRGAELDLTFTELSETRERTLRLVADLDSAALEAVHSPLLSPLVWDLGHIAAFEDLWISRTFEESMVRPDLVQVYDADETPRSERGDLPFLETDAAYAHMEAVRERTLALLDAAGDRANPDRLQLVIRHEQQHNETMLQTFQLAHLASPFRDRLDRFPAGVTNPDPHGLNFMDVDGATVPIGADPAAGFAYDNEKQRHMVDVKPFRIGRTPVTNAAWLDFIDRGGYQRPEWWSPEGWAWRQAEQVSTPLAWTQDGRQWRMGELTALDPAEPVIHVSCFEADAFARAHELRLPTEFEWELAATSVPEALGMIGNVWEWTASTFDPYPGFIVDPYPEYSEQFFGYGYRVLRGGSWVTMPLMATTTFRNWDLPQRRQIFSGLRLAGDAR